MITQQVLIGISILKIIIINYSQQSTGSIGLLYNPNLKVN
jgi:hypothetical protein